MLYNMKDKKLWLDKKDVLLFLKTNEGIAKTIGITPQGVRLKSGFSKPEHIEAIGKEIKILQRKNYSKAYTRINEQMGHARKQLRRKK